MLARTEYVLTLAGEFAAFDLVHASATLIAFFVFACGVGRAVTRKMDKEKYMAQLPLKD